MPAFDLDAATQVIGRPAVNDATQVINRGGYKPMNRLAAANEPTQVINPHNNKAKPVANEFDATVVVNPQI